MNTSKTPPAKGFLSRCLLALLLVTAPVFQGAEAATRERIRYHIPDHAGSPMRVVTPEGFVVAKYRYAPLGEQVADKAPFGNRPRTAFVGGIQENPSLVYLKHRYYNPALGRFYQPDPVTYLAGGPTQINRYAYGLNDAYRYSDPDGRCLPACAIYGALLLWGAWSASGDIVTAANEPTSANIMQATVSTELALAGMGPLKSMTSFWSTAEKEVVRTAVANTATRWGPATGAGPLGAEVAATFRGGSYTELVTQETTTLYRAYGGSAGELGSYWTRTLPAGPLQTRIDSALLSKWGNTAESISTIRVPTGTTIYEGFAAPQGSLFGGGSQVFIPTVNPAWLIK